MELGAKVRATVERYSLFQPGEAVVVGVSGGPDSLCLLHILKGWSETYPLQLYAAHLNHQLRGGEGEADAQFVAQVSAEWGIPAVVESCDVRAYAERGRLSIEEAARQARYSFLARTARKVGASCVAVGHNADDQVETIVMHWLRGAGLAGLRGMLPSSPLEGLRLVRPLLEVERAEIENYLRVHGLHPRFDRSNLDLTYHRNRIRHELVPLLATYNPNIGQVLRRSAAAIADDYAYLGGEVEKAWAEVAQEEGEAVVFKRERWLALPVGLQRYLLREAIRRLRRELRNINWVHIENALQAARGKPTGTQVTLPQNLTLFIGYETLTIASRLPLPDVPLLAEDLLPVKVPGRMELPGGPWALEVHLVEKEELEEGWAENPDPWRAFLDYERTGEEPFLRCRRPGDRFQPLGMEGEKLLREFMIDAKIPAYIRDRVPILAAGERILWVCGFRIDERARVAPRTRRVLALTFRKEVKSSGNGREHR